MAANHTSPQNNSARRCHAINKTQYQFSSEAANNINYFLYMEKHMMISLGIP